MQPSIDVSLFLISWTFRKCTPNSRNGLTSPYAIAVSCIYTGYNRLLSNNDLDSSVHQD